MSVNVRKAENDRGRDRSERKSLSSFPLGHFINIVTKNYFKSIAVKVKVR